MNVRDSGAWQVCTILSSMNTSLTGNKMEVFPLGLLQSSNWNFFNVIYRKNRYYFVVVYRIHEVKFNEWSLYLYLPWHKLVGYCDLILILLQATACCIIHVTCEERYFVRLPPVIFACIHWYSLPKSFNGFSTWKCDEYEDKNLEIIYMCMPPNSMTGIQWLTLLWLILSRTGWTFYSRKQNCL